MGYLPASTSHGPTGRPRSFDLEAAIASTVPIFREHGFDGASIDLLKKASGLTVGSIYKAFGNKNGLFEAAFAKYVEDRQEMLAELLVGLKTGRERIAATLRFYLESASGPDGRRGCLVLASLVEATTLDDVLRDQLEATMTRSRENILLTLREGQQDGSIRADLAIDSCANLLLGLLQGMRAMGKLNDFTDRETLITTALKLLD